MYIDKFFHKKWNTLLQKYLDNSVERKLTVTTRLKKYLLQ